MISISMNKDQYEQIHNELAKTEGVVLTLNGPNATITHLQSPQLDADVLYVDGNLLLSNIKKHGIAKFASEDNIKSHLINMMGELKCSTTPIPAPNSTDAKS